MAKAAPKPKAKPVDPIVSEIGIEPQSVITLDSAEPPPKGGASEMHKRIAEMMDLAYEAGVRHDDPMHRLFEAAAAMSAEAADQNLRHAERMEKLFAAQGESHAKSLEQAKLDVQEIGTRTVEDLKQSVEIEIAKAATRLPFMIGRMRALLLAASLVATASVGLAVGVWWGQSNVESAMAVDARTPWTPTWLNLRSMNNIDAELREARCDLQAGRKACTITMWVEPDKTPSQ